MTERGAWRLLLALAALNVLGYVDRQLVAALAPVLMAELGLTRADIGFLIGPAFVVVFALGTLVLGAAADRGRRPRIIAGGLAAWSAATALTGTASGFATLVLWRGLVGVGEATLPPTAVAMLGDRFPPSRLGFATSVYYAGIPVGFACSLALAGWLVPRFGWRACFFLLGVARARRGRARVADGRPAAAGRPRRAGRSRGPRAAGTIASPAAPRVRRRAHALAPRRGRDSPRVPERLLPAPRHLARAGARLRLLARGLPGGRPWSSGRGSPAASPSARSPTRPSAAGRAGGSSPSPASGPCRSPPTAAFYLLPAASPLFLAAWLVAQAWTLGWFGPMLAAIHDLAPAGSRGTVIGFCLMAVNLVGVGLGPWVTGAIGDRAGLTAGLLASVAVGAVGLALVALVALRDRRS